MHSLDFATVYPPEAAALEARLRPGDTLSQLLARYRGAVALWERWFLEDVSRVWTYEGDLDWVTRDLTACANCDGAACRTVMAQVLAQRSGQPVEAGSARAGYYSVVPGPYGDPHFGIYPCTNPAARRERVLRIYQRLREQAARLMSRLEGVAR